MKKSTPYYIFWSIVGLFLVLALLGSAYIIVSQSSSCPIPQATTITVESIPISIESHEADRSSSRPTKWVDPDNQTVHYMYADGSGRVIPMYSTVPPMWYENMLKSYINLHGEAMPEEIVEAIPWEWKNAVMPMPSRPLPEGGSPN